MKTTTTLHHWHDAEPDALASLFKDTFSEAADETEGRVVSELARSLMTSTPQQDLYGFIAQQDKFPVAAIFFSRLSFDDSTECFLLSPVAVLPAFQNQGLGQTLIRYGINELVSNGVTALFTYGDPAFYGKLGFEPVSVADAQPPYPLSQPEGWLFRALAPEITLPLRGSAACVAAMQDPSIW